MMLSGVGRLCLTAGLIVLLTACGGQSGTALAPAALEPGASASNVSPDAKQQDLLYISTVANSKANVLIYTYPKGRYKERVNTTGLTFPRGECTDKRGNVYVTNESSDSSSSSILEYAHGDKQPKRTLKVDGAADRCAVDPATGNLAVVSSELAVFRAARGKPTYLAYPTGFRSSACDYDGKGNLFVNGVRKQSPSRAVLYEIPADGHNFAKVSLPPIPEAKVPGDVRWDGTDLALGDGGSSIYRLAIRDRKATDVGIVQMYGAAGVQSFAIADDDIVAANSASRTAMIWAYPAGGQPFKVFYGVGNSVGVAVSLAHK
jgi:hypothetical protein